MSQKRVILISGQSLFGSGLLKLLEGQKDQLVIEKVPDVHSALQISETFQPEVVVFFKEKGEPEDERLLQEINSKYHARVIHCTLEANQLTIYDKTSIKNVTVEDLMSAVLK
ncbi:MAG TPA: hypothetical protein VLB09_09740 [Nitrospiria bacterium]|nr:hypothetical protein [Nitrospiria bacterium]